MPLWGNNDTAAQSAIFAVSQMNKAPNTANRTALFGNTTANGYGTSTTIGQYGVDSAEMRAARASGVVRPAHSGWVLKRTGQGGRAGRVTYETLVATHGLSGDAEDTSFPDVGVLLLTQPSPATGDISNNDIVKFTTSAQAVPAGTVTYKWQKWGGASFADITDAGAYSNSSTAQLSVLANVETTGAIYRCNVSSTGATSRLTTNAVITIVP